MFEVVECPKCGEETDVEEWDIENDRHFETTGDADIIKELDKGTKDGFVYFCPKCKEEIDGDEFDRENIRQYRNEVVKEYDNMGMIIDSPIEELTKVLEKLRYSELLNFKKMVELQYQELETLKNQLLATEDDTEEVKEVVQDLYKLLQKVEDIAIVTEELKRQRKIKD